jgi:hypothetical protein
MQVESVSRTHIKQLLNIYPIPQDGKTYRQIQREKIEAELAAAVPGGLIVL